MDNTLGTRGVLILCYHGVVAGDHQDQTFLYRNTVSAREFRFQLEFLRRHFHPISAADLINHLERATPISPRAALITFDDGYRNNLTLAAPLLAEFGVPALFSVTTDYIGHNDVLWPDEVNLRVLYWPQSTIPYPTSEGGFSSIPLSSDAGSRIASAERIRSACKNLPEARRVAYLAALRDVPCRELEQRDRELYDFLSWDDVRFLANKGFDIGSHTVSHPILTQISGGHLAQEVRQSKARIESETGRSCKCLVYPNGQTDDFSDKVMEASRDAGYRLAFSATGEYASLQGSCYALSRIGVPGHQPEAVFESRVSGLHTWMKNFL